MNDPIFFCVGRYLDVIIVSVVFKYYTLCAYNLDTVDAMNYKFICILHQGVK